MVDYDEAVRIIQDTNADPVLLAKVTYENPEFGANVAAHPRAYPGLLRWIAEFGDERARQMAASLGYVAADGGVEDRYVEEGVAVSQAQPAQGYAEGYAEPYAETDGEASAQADADAQPAQPAAEAQPAAAQESGLAQLQQEYDQASMEPAANYMAQPVYTQPDQAVQDAQAAQAAQVQPTAQSVAQSVLQIQATNPYGFTAELAATTTDSTQMQQIAQYAPELHPALAINPNLYSALVDWLYQLNEPATIEALQTRAAQ
ncbi:hypothetical protein [Bifidobacterium gallicum]|uniref:Leucine rich repeat variant domain-containing protein n=1 Tax=Bifidobacterium gallicum DSM 20093 = LMG 11596 TaxID=561180 RepID=D1NTA7_9BIFI|nr:hypothetical protein [Bifidobacterium gallicum]EFA22961.1 hypothetical protein BIFGAL_03064 [Bifidobacterium gallicum DSM 20093 = LMG 11596]KFI57716.1 hypothetical protein BGLCM_1406 [Bifidobacterium gallicum DSM 20093 = LMG 11596]